MSYTAPDVIALLEKPPVGEFAELAHPCQAMVLCNALVVIIRTSLLVCLYSQLARRVHSANIMSTFRMSVGR